MTTNREEHDMAAKAAGLKLQWKTGVCKGGAYEAPFVERDGELVAWRPKDDATDSFGLLEAIDLSDIERVPPNLGYYVYGKTPRSLSRQVLSFSTDLKTAIFYAAVNLGRIMP